jgi:type II secretory pathway component PulJ
MLMGCWSGKVKSLSALLDLLCLRFGSKNQRERHRVELRTRRQRSDETMQTVYQDIRRLLSLAFPGPSTDTTEAIGRDAFLDNLGDHELALKVRER